MAFRAGAAKTGTHARRQELEEAQLRAALDRGVQGFPRRQCTPHALHGVAREATGHDRREAQQPVQVRVALAHGRQAPARVVVLARSSARFPPAVANGLLLSGRTAAIE